MAYGWEGDKVRLVPLDYDKHFENCLRWANDPDVTQWLLMGDFPLTRLAEKKWFDGVSEGSDTHVLFAIETRDGRHIGNSGLHEVDFRNGVAQTGTLIGEVGEWGKGYGTDAALVRARYAFEVLGLRMLTSGVIDGNERSLRMQLRVGYQVVGRIPERFWKRGALRDEIITVLRRP